MSFLDEQKLYDDHKYRSYASQIEKALKNFEYSTEWADLISALVKLNKVLLSNTSYKILPKRITIGKRLAQCLHPALPGGVHIKGLEVYDTIFKIIGQRQLEMNLHIFGAGLFSLLANASMQVRPVLLNVYETHLLQLGERLRPSLDGMLLGLLSGLEEGSEHFDRITLLLNTISKNVGAQYFYSSLWRCVLCSPTGSIIRLAAAQLVLRQFDKKKMTDDQLHLIGLDVDIMIHALCEALQDENVLTQRATLDVLIFCFPLSSLPVSKSDAQQVMSCAVNILLRRDMSLNRRLYSWLMCIDLTKSSSSTTSASSEYFEKYAQEILTNALRDGISTGITAFRAVCCVKTANSLIGTEVRLLRIVTSLLDKSDIGPVVLNDIMPGLIRLIETVDNTYRNVLSADHRCKKCPSVLSLHDRCSRALSEFVKLVNLFVNSFESDYIWNVLGDYFAQSCVASSDRSEPDESRFAVSEICDVIKSVLEIVSIETIVDIQTLYLPELLNKIFVQLTFSCGTMSEADIACCLRISTAMLKRIQPVRNEREPDDSVTKSPITSCVKSFQDFIANFVSSKIISDVDDMSRFVENMKKPAPLAEDSCQIGFESRGSSNSVLLEAFQDSCRLLIDISCFPTLSLPNHVRPSDETHSDVVPEWLHCLMACSCHKEIKSTPPGSIEESDYFYEIRKSACSAVLELLAASRARHGDACSAASTVVSVVVPAPLTTTEIEFVFENTDYVEKAGAILWNELADEPAGRNRSALQRWSLSRNLVELHELCPTDAVERLLLGDLLDVDQAKRVAAVEKFAKLWRHMRAGSRNRAKDKCLSRCLFAVLDQLDAGRYASFPCRPGPKDHGNALASTTVSVWLRQALEEGDLSRVLEPYFLITLEQNTNRKSLQYVLRDTNSAVPDADRIDDFVRRHEENVQGAECQTCADCEGEFDEAPFSWADYRGLSAESAISTGLCQVHRQIDREKRRYDRLVALLTLSDDLENPDAFSSSEEEDLNLWAAGFVSLVVAQATRQYQCGLGDNDDKDMDDDGNSSAGSSLATEAIELNRSFVTNENPLFSHVLIYQERFDASRVLYGLRAVLTIAAAHPSVFIYSACTTSLSSSESSYSNLVQELLVRHERSIEQGRSFYEATPASSKGAMKNRMLIEALISVCLYYLRSAFRRDANAGEVDSNHEIHTVAARLLKFIVRELRNLAREDVARAKGTKPSSAKQFSAYVVLVLQRQQVQSVALTCLLTTIFALKNHGRPADDEYSLSNYSGHDANLNFDEEAARFGRSDNLVERYLGNDVAHVGAMFSHFLELVFELVTLERYAFSKERKPQSTNSDEPAGSPGVVMNKKRGSLVKPTLKRSHRLFSHLLSASHQYDSDLPLASQKVFVSTVLEVYRLEHHPSLHQECSIGLHSVLDCLGMALSGTVLPVLLQQCLNLENATKMILQGSRPSLPPCYLENTISSIVRLCHYCLLTESGNGNDRPSADNPQADSISLVSSKTTQSTGNYSLGWFNLLNVFSMSNGNKSASASNDVDCSDGVRAAKISILNNLARIVSCVCFLWKDIVMVNAERLISSDEVKGVSYAILQLLGPMAFRYGEYLLVAFSLVWQDRETDKTPSDFTKSILTSPLAKPNPSLDHIIDLLMAVKLLSPEMFFSLMKQVVRNPPPTANERKDVSLHESLLQMLLFYMRRLKPGALLENWSGLLPILQETLAMGPVQNNQCFFSADNPVTANCYFLLMYLVAEYVKRAVVFAGKKEQKELQDIVAKCVEACNVIAGSSLEQGTWIRRTVSVLPGPQAPETSVKTHRKTESQSSLDLTDATAETVNEPQLHASSSDTMVAILGQKTDENKDRTESQGLARPTSLHQITKPAISSVNLRNSVKALTVLAEVVANLLDVVYSSEEKERIVPILVPIMTNVTPYLRNHNKDNSPSYGACVSLLSSVSGFQYTRRAWRKEVIDLFMDGAFFHMPPGCVDDWKNIVDNLMTHDKLTFKDIMSRTTLSKTGGSTPTLSLFSNKEQELELRALHIKRLAFIVFSSEADQYQRQLPEIQERLAESLRLNNIPGVQCRVFLCLRVLLVRISPHSLTSLWPTIFTELVHAMTQLEQALQPAVTTESKRSRFRAKLGKATSQSSVDRKTVMTCWDDMYLAACKLLDLILCLPSRCVPQFQLFKWSFVGDVTVDATQNASSTNHFHPIDENQPSGAGTPVDIDPDNIETGFIPHCVRIHRLFCELYPSRKERRLTVVPQKPLLNVTKLRCLEQLHPFFNTITSPEYLLKMQRSQASSQQDYKSQIVPSSQLPLPLVERTLERDFVRNML